MHAVIGILIAVSTLIFWLGRAARGAGDVADAANTIANLPRKRRYLKESRKSGLDLVTDPLQAATVLMIAIAKISDIGRVSDAAQAEIIKQLRGVGQSHSDADGIFRQVDSLLYDMVMPENSIFPMVDLLQKTVDRNEARDVVDMMTAIAKASKGPNAEQKEFIRRFSERMNLL